MPVSRPLRTPPYFRYTSRKSAATAWARRTAMAFTAQHLYFEDIEVGQQWESLGRTITEADVVNFAGISGDFNPIHIDQETAKSGPFGKPIAHGLLGLSIASGLGSHSPRVDTLAFLSILEWHFREPIFFGDTVQLIS